MQAEKIKRCGAILDEGKQRPAFTKDGECPSGGVAAAAPPGYMRRRWRGEEKEKGAGWLSALGGMAGLRGDAQDKVRAAAPLRLARAVRAQPSWPRGVRGTPLLPQHWDSDMFCGFAPFRGYFLRYESP